MNVVLWIIAGLLGVAFLAAGGMKLAKDKSALAASGMGWAADYSAGAVKGIGAVEVLGALGIILPGLFRVATILVPIAAVGLVLTMAAAIVVHLRRNETKMVGAPAALLILAAFLAVGRFGAWSGF